MARELGVPATIVAPHNAAATKLAAVERLGGTIVRVTWDEWWAAMEAGHIEGVEGLFIHPVQDDAVMAGNGTIGLELVDELDGFDAVLIPWGGGGLTTGIASAVKALRPEVEIYVCEPETGAPMTAAIENGRVPVKVDYTASFIDGAGSGALLPKMWELAEPLVDRRIRGLARGRGRGGADARGARACRRRGRGWTSHRGCARGSRRGRADGLHRLRREHRLRSAGSDPRRPRPRLSRGKVSGSRRSSSVTTRLPEEDRTMSTSIQNQPPTTNPNKALWEKGDFTRIAATMRESGEEVVASLGIGEGHRSSISGAATGRRPSRQRSSARTFSRSTSPATSSRRGKLAHESSA